MENENSNMTSDADVKNLLEEFIINPDDYKKALSGNESLKESVKGSLEKHAETAKVFLEEHGEEEFIKVLGESLITILKKDPEIPEGAAFAAAWIDDGTPVANISNLTGEVYLIQLSPNDTEIQISGWFELLEPYTYYELTIHRFGDLDSTDYPCQNSGGVFVPQNESEFMRFIFASDKNGNVQLNFTTMLAPLWGNDSVVGRMLVVAQIVNKTDEHVSRRRDLYQPKHYDVADSLKTEIAGCGVVGYGNDFTIVPITTNNYQAIKTDYCIIIIIFFASFVNVLE